MAKLRHVGTVDLKDGRRDQYVREKITVRRIANEGRRNYGTERKLGLRGRITNSWRNLN